MPTPSVTQTLLKAQWSAKQIRLPDHSVIDKGLLVLPVSRHHKDHYERFQHSILTYFAKMILGMSSDLTTHPIDIIPDHFCFEKSQISLQKRSNSVPL